MSAIRTKTWLVSAVASMLVFLWTAVPAQASFHVMQIREVYPGTAANSHNDAYVILQMYAPGQNFVGGHTFTSYSGGAAHTIGLPFGSSVPNGQNNATILIGGDAVPGSDYTATLLGNDLPASGAAVCWADVDCVSFGSGAGTTLPSPAGTPLPRLTDGVAVGRKITRGCATLLDADDDTNDSAADFTNVSPNPRNNAAPITEKPCGRSAGVGTAGPPNTKIKKHPENRSGDTSPTFKFKSTESGSKFKCKLDRRKFGKCKSPKTYHGLGPGKHVFKVEAIDADGNVDKSPAKDRFKIVP